MKKRAALCALLTLCGATLPARAEPTESDLPQLGDDGSPAARALAERADADGDGRVSYREFSRVVRQSVDKQVALRFRQLDRNRDGRITRAEVNKMDARRFARFDSNRDGAFTQAELGRVIGGQLEARLLRLHVLLDQDRDRSLSVAELTPRKAPTNVATAKTAASERF